MDCPGSASQSTHDEVLRKLYLLRVSFNLLHCVLTRNISSKIFDVNLSFDSNANDGFTLSHTETDKEADKKWLVQNCVEVFTLHRDRLRQIPIGFCVHLSGSVSVSVSNSVNFDHLLIHLLQEMTVECLESYKYLL